MEWGQKCPFFDRAMASWYSSGNDMAYLIEEKKDTIHIQATGKKIADAFVFAAQGFFSLQFPLEDVRDDERVKIAIDAKDESTLLKAWISELLLKQDVEKIYLGAFRIASIQRISATQCLLTGEAFGEKQTPERPVKRNVSLDGGQVVCRMTDDTYQCEITLRA